MSASDYAIVIGINQYPTLGDSGNPLNLNGPWNDVEEIVGWLKNEGEVPDANITSITSPQDNSPNAALPTILELNQAVINLVDIANANNSAGKGRKVGRRLYIYMTGHGFSPAPVRGCLYAANASPSATYNVHATGWVSWLQDSGYFQEIVLWMDCCMDRIWSVMPGEPPLPPLTAPTPAGPTFIAFAAQRPLKAVEAPIQEDKGKIHGVFTWALLEGLRGAAVDASGRITGRSLADWIRNAQSNWMLQADRNDTRVAIEPWVIREDQDLFFARGVASRKYTVELHFPADAAGHLPILWSGVPPRSESLQIIANGSLTLDLSPGLYVIDLPATRTRQGLEVVGPGKVEIRDTGEPVVPDSEGTLFQLSINPNDPTAEIFVIDSRFSLVDRDLGRLETKLPFNLYKIKIRIGRTITERVVLIDRDHSPITQAATTRNLSPTPIVAMDIAPRPATIAPIGGTAVKHEYQERAALNARAQYQTLKYDKGEAAFMLMARVWSGEDSKFVTTTTPWEGITVVDTRGKIVADFSQDGKHSMQEGDPYSVLTKSIKPGTYFLRQRMDHQFTMEQALVLVQGWALEVYVLRYPVRPEISADRVSNPTESRLLDSRPYISMIMKRIEGYTGNSTIEDRILEAARVALINERPILNSDLEIMLFEKFNNPLAGIIGGHLLIIEHEQNPHRDLVLLNKVVKNLRGLVGEGHPDVEALSLRCPDLELQCKSAIKMPPMLLRSWKLLVDASYENRKLIPKKVFTRIEGQACIPPFLVWAHDKELKSSSREYLRQTLFGSIGPTPIFPKNIQTSQASTAAMVTDNSPIPTAVERTRPHALNDLKAVEARARQMGLPSCIVGMLVNE